MALRHRRPLLSERTVNAGARLLTWLHVPVVTVAVLLALVAFDVWLFGFHGIAGGLRSVIYEPSCCSAVFGSVVVAHRVPRVRPRERLPLRRRAAGRDGRGLYLVWPAFYCDVTDAYRLDRRGRLRTDLGGVYFNGIFALLLRRACTPSPASRRRCSRRSSSRCSRSSSSCRCCASTATTS